MDLPHYGHLKIIQRARAVSDYVIAGILTDKAVMSYKRRPIMPYWQRKSIAEEFRSVDMVMMQKSRDPTENLKKIHKDNPRWKIILIHGSDWKNVPGQKYVESIGGRLFQPPYYKPLSTTKIIEKIKQSR